MRRKNKMDPVARAEAKNQLANTYFGLQKYAIAIQYYTDAIKICPQVAKYYNNRAQCHIKMYEFVKGLVDAKKCVELDRVNIKGYLRLVECSLCSGDVKFAEKTIQTAVGVLPQNQDILDGAERVRMLQRLEADYVAQLARRNYAGALQTIEKSLETTPLCLGYMVKKAECFMLLERFQNAEDLAEEILNFKPTNEDAIYIKACSQLYRQDLDNTTFGIIRELKRQQPDHLKTVRIFQNTTMILNAQNNAQKAVEQRDFELAYKLLTQAIKVDENYKYVRRKLYLQKIEIANKDKQLLWPATKDCTEYLELFENDVEILKKRAQFYMELEEYDLAIEDYQVVLSYQDVSANRNKLKQAKTKYKDQSNELYKILKLPAKHTKDDVVRAFRELVLHYHPDRRGEITPARKKLLENKLIRARNAMESLLRKFK